MKKMNYIDEERARELQKYITTLTNLQANGFNCMAEIQVAIKALHEAMGFSVSPNSKPMHIVVLERDYNGVIKSVEAFESLLSIGLAKVKRAKLGSDHEVRSGNIIVSIIKAEDLKYVEYKTKGWTVDYVINNSTYLTSLFNLKMRINK